MKSGDRVIVGFWVTQDSTSTWKEKMIERREWTDEVFVYAHQLIGTSTYLSFYERFKPNWRVVYAVVE